MSHTLVTYSRLETSKKNASVYFYWMQMFLTKLCTDKAPPVPSEKLVFACRIMYTPDPYRAFGKMGCVNSYNHKCP